MFIHDQFYQLQNEWSKIYTRPVSSYDREKTKLVTQFSKNKPKSILEIGCGGGQFSTACAELGHIVTGLDIEPTFIKYANQNISAELRGNLTFVEADFYNYQPGFRYDMICYLDGFGIGSDDDQKRLLGNLSNWLKPDGTILLEVYTPWYWSRSDQTKQNTFGNAARSYHYDAYNNRLIDEWWLTDLPEQKVAQSLRCYAPADLALLLSSTDLVIDDIFPGGAVNTNTGTFETEVALINAMSYTAKLIHLN